MKQIKLAIIALVLLVPLAHARQANTAGTKIAYYYPNTVLMESDAAKKYAKDSEAMFKPRIDEIAKLEKKFEEANKEFQKEAATMTDAKRESSQLDLKRKYEDLQLRKRQLQMDKARADQAELAKLEPKLIQAAKAVKSAMSYNVLDPIMPEKERFMVIDPELDLTKRVIERLNQMK